MIELPASHPLFTTGGQMRHLWQICWRWLFAGILAALFGKPMLGLAIALLLLHLWFRSLRQADFWSPFFDELASSQLWVSRAGLLVVAVLGVAWNWGDPSMAPFIAAWAGFISAMLIESFVVPSLLTAEKEAP